MSDSIYDENSAGALDSKSNTVLKIKQLEEQGNNIFTETGIDTGNVIVTFETDQKFAKPKVTVNEKATPEQMQRAVDNALYLLIKSKEGMDLLGLPVAPAIEPIGAKELNEQEEVSIGNNIKKLEENT